MAKSPFNHLFFSFLVLSVLIVSSTAIFSYTHIRNLLNDKQATHISEQLSRISSAVENTLQSLDSIAFSYATDPRLSEILRQPFSVTDFTRYREVTNKLNFIQAQAPPFTQADVISFTGNWRMYNNSLHQLSPDTAADYLAFYRNLMPISREPETNAVKLVRPLPLTTTIPDGFLIVRIPYESVLALIQQINPVRYLAVTDALGELIFSTGLESHTDNQPNLSQLVHIAGVNFGLRYYTTPDWDIYYDVLDSVMASGLIFIGLIALAIMLVGWVLYRRNRLIVQTQLNQLRDLFLINLFSGHLKDENEIYNRFQHFGLPRDFMSFQVVSLGIAQELMDNTLLEIIKMVSQLLPARSCIQPVLIDSETLSLFVLNYTAAPFPMNDTFLPLKQTINEVFGVSLCIGVSSAHTLLTDTRKAFKESTRALSNRIIMGERQLIFYDEVLKLSHDKNLHYPTEQIQQLLTAIKGASDTDSRELLETILEEIYHANQNLEYFQISVFKLVNELINLMQTLRIDISTKLQKNFYTVFSELKTLAEVKTFVHQILAAILETTLKRKEDNYDHVIEKVLDIIREEFDQPLTLEHIADRVNYNPNYLSGLFKKVANQSFSECLAETRHQMSKQWLAESKITIKDIAEKLQYSNSQNFIRQFKKIEGVTPGEYRKSQE